MSSGSMSSGSVSRPALLSAAPNILESGVLDSGVLESGMTPSKREACETEESAVGDFLALLKPGVMSLAVFTATVGLLLAPHQPHPILGIIAVLCIAVGAGAAGAINMWFDRDIDAIMTRTRRRPIPDGRLTAANALAFGVILAVFSVTIIGLALNYLAAFLLAMTIGFYVFIYTMWLKRRTPQNIVIGGLAGAFPPLVGWAAASGEISLYPLLMTLIIFLWTPPHFWALALYRNGDYAKAGVPMMPVTAGAGATCRQIVIYSLLLMVSAILPWVLGLAGAVYGVSAVLLSWLFLHHALAVWDIGARDGHAAARALFTYSIFYLFLLFSAMLVDYAIIDNPVTISGF